ncbi:hypothetical protein AURDEDRAFT_81612 [Auricularia subglabra TFB-10046 SS5]|nr:hypothetical protein AURDEDRAFT_81612 [Auricularia subglabra TFB-10046 SS5]
MDRAGRLFSRGNSPGSSQQSNAQGTPTQQQQQPAPGSPHSVHSMNNQQGPADNGHLDSLFRNIGQQQPQQQQQVQYGPQPLQSGTASSTPLSHTSAGTQQQSNADKASALLSTLYGAPQPQSLPPIGLHNMGQQDRPPSPAQAQRSPDADNNPGKMLLETLMAGTAPKQAPVPVQQQPVQQQQQQQHLEQHRIAQPMPSIPTPPNLTPDLERGLNPPSQPPTPPQQQQPVQRPQQQPRQPSPSRKSMFEFVSPFDALASSSSGPRKKPIPQAPEDPPSPGAPAPLDPRRKSVENLLQEISKPLPGPEPKAKQQKASPRASPPRTLPQRPPLRSSEASSLTHVIPAAQPVAGRERNSSPAPRGGNNNGPPAGQGKGAGGRGKKQSAPAPVAPQPQTIVFDVSQAEVTTQASSDLVKSTAIALLKIDPIFVPGCTIGVTSWVAYAMTRGRVRVIGRANGERTLLQLPSLFPPTTTVIDMVVTGNRLAAVTSDGGFVIWEVPRVVEDDAPAQLLLCVVPSDENPPLKVVKWHPKQADTLAVGSNSEIFLINVAEAINAFHGDPISQNELARLGTVYNLVSPLVSFAFDATNYTIMAISEDSTLSSWSNMDKLPAFTAKILGEGIPSSIDVIDGGVVIGRKQGTVLQLLPAYSADVLATARFVNGAREDREMFGHVAYDHRIRTLWVANSRRESLIALRIALDPAEPHSGYFDQLVEFPGLKPTIHFVILSADADPRGEEAEAACVAAKLDPGSLALVAYSVHAHGVDQVLIRSEWFEMALSSVPLRPPPIQSAVPLAVTQGVVPTSSPSSSDNKPGRMQHQAHLHHPQPIPLHHNPLAAVPARPRTPSSEDIEAEVAAAVDSRLAEAKPRGPKNGPKDKNKQKEQQQQQQQQQTTEKDTRSDVASGAVVASGSGSGSGNDTLGMLSKELRKSEDNLQTKIGRLITKELEKQQQRLEDMRAEATAADFARQEKIIKLISTELTKNTTRVVEAAVKGVVQNSVLPSLETITKNEVRSALNSQIAKGLGDSLAQTLPSEIERLLLRPDVANHVARSISLSVTPQVERHVKEAVTKTLIPAYMQQTEAMHQDLSRELHGEIVNVKKEIITWQGEALKGQEAVIREMELTIKTLSEQVKFLTNALVPGMQAPPPVQGPLRRMSPIHSAHSQQGSSHMRQGPLPIMHSGAPQQMYAQNSPYAPPPPPPQPQPQQNNQPWFPASHAQLSSQGHMIPTPPTVSREPMAPEEWDETYIAVLASQDSGQLRDLLARSNPDVVMPLDSHIPLSQAVVLTLSHRIASALPEVSPSDEFFKSAIWWIQRTMAVLNVHDSVISTYANRVLSAVVHMLSQVRQRISILPVPQVGEASRAISDLTDLVSRKLNSIPA